MINNVPALERLARLLASAGISSHDASLSTGADLLFMANITNLNKPKDAFEQLEDEHGARQGFCHIRIQQRTG
ncbi:unnamed protein product, partial [Cylicostephanus goldi]